MCLSECLDINPDCEIACRKLPPKPKCQSHDPRQCDWYCNAKRMKCSNGEEYHCAREVNNKFTDVCAKEVYCLKGNTNVYKSKVKTNRVQYNDIKVAISFVINN